MLIDKLKELNTIPMHMPGHKRNLTDFKYLKEISAEYDITEIHGFDNLHSPEGILKESMQMAARMRGANHAFYLVNGATCGILASILAAVSEGDKVICARNCHKSVYNALELSGAETIFFMPEYEPCTGGFGCINTTMLSEIIESNSDASLIIITSPTYEGIVSDVSEICRTAHKKGIPVLVDAAHGAHFGFGYGFPQSAVECGADICVESLHKTLPSLTQTAICYVSGELINPKAVADKLSVFETSSPSYLLMASIDGCINLLSRHADEYYERWQQNLDFFYKKTEGLKNLKILLKKDGFFDFDRSKIVIYGINGKWLFEALYSLGFECEAVSEHHVIAMSAMGDTKENLSAFADALIELDRQAVFCPSNKIMLFSQEESYAMCIKKAVSMHCEPVCIEDCEGRISAGYIWAYPPGIPILIPGEYITCDKLKILTDYEKNHIELKGKINKNKINVIK